MEDFLNETVSSAFLQVCKYREGPSFLNNTNHNPCFQIMIIVSQKIENEYNRDPSPNTQFVYAMCLVRSKYSSDMSQGLFLLEDLCRHHPEGKRDYIYYLAFGNARLHEYGTAIRYIEKFQEIEPQNEQVQQLLDFCKKRRTETATKGAAILGGVAMLVGGLAALGFGMLKK